MEAMKVQVLKVKSTSQGWNLAYCQCDGLIGTVIADSEVKEPGEYWLQSSLSEKDGRIVPQIIVKKSAS
jgi:hypothetical protein